MKKNAKVKKSKSSSKGSAEAVPVQESLDLLSGMMKLVERLEVLERKTDQVLGRVSNLPSEIRNVVQQSQRPNVSHPAQAQPQQHSQPVHRPDHASSQGHGQPEVRKDRTMYQAVCADCRKNCEVPFRPTEERPVYCKECFTIRKAGHRSQDPDSRSRAVPSPKYMPSVPTYKPQGNTASGNVAVAKGGKHKAARNAGVKSKKKR